MAHPYEAEVRNLFADVPDAEVRELFVGLARDYRIRHPEANKLPVRELSRDLTTRLAERKGIARSQMNHLAPELERLDKPWLAPLNESVWWFIGAGLGVDVSGSGHYASVIQLTRAGVRFLDSTDDHPLRPQFLERLKTRCAGIPDGVLDLLDDASACLERGLMRPAIAVMGVAMESAVETIVEALIVSGHLQAQLREKSPSLRIQALRPLIPTLVPGSTKADIDNRYAVERALLFADDLRRRRNDASHTKPRFGFDDRAEIEEWLVSMGRQLPVLWLLHR